jgi:hypothetical protein
MSQDDSTAELNLVPLTEGGLDLELSEMEAMSVKMLLDANGIPAVVRGTSLMPNLPQEILVPMHQLEEAVRIVADARQAGA